MPIYNDHYGLTRDPFHITPDPHFLYLSPGHRDAYGAILYGIHERKGFILLSGEVGMGKTTVLRALLEEIRSDATLRLIYLFNPALEFDELVATLLNELGETSPGSDAARRLVQLQDCLLARYRAGLNVVLVIDEAQAIPPETLERLRFLSNIETATEKLLQIVLVGQPELLSLLGRHELRQLNQRIAVRARVDRLSRRDSLRYIEHRLRQAGCSDPASVFTRGARDLIAARAAGVPRRINILCDNALVAAYGAGCRRVDRRIAREIAEEQQLTQVPARSVFAPFLARAVLAVGLLTIAASFGARDPMLHPPTHSLAELFGVKRDRDRQSGALQYMAVEYGAPAWADILGQAPSTHGASAPPASVVSDGGPVP